MQRTAEPRDRPVTTLLRASEYEELRELMWKTRQPMSGWLREVALRAMEDLVQQDGARER